MSSTDPFVDYYTKQSEAPATTEHFLRLRQMLLKVHGPAPAGKKIRVADIGCGAGTFSRIFAGAGCAVRAVDVNPKLIEVAQTRARAGGVDVDYSVGSAAALPWSGAEFDIVALPELLEHVHDWQSVLSEAARVLSPGGILFVSTTNRLCPVQQEFDLPLYSWYPGWLKKRCLVLSTTTKREWVSHALYPAEHWFDPYWLGAEFRKLGMNPLDRFDLLAMYSEGGLKQWAGKLARAVPPLRFIGHVLSPGTTIVGRKVQKS
jgi:ubiquinone/menaquinone biosynthesis C-methylase UbiE